MEFASLAASAAQVVLVMQLRGAVGVEEMENWLEPEGQPWGVEGEPEEAGGPGGGSAACGWVGLHLYPKKEWKPLGGGQRGAEMQAGNLGMCILKNWVARWRRDWSGSRYPGPAGLSGAEMWAAGTMMVAVQMQRSKWIQEPQMDSMSS